MPDFPDPYLLMGVTPEEVDGIEVFAQRLVQELVELVREVVEKARKPVTLAYAEVGAQLATNRETGKDNADDRVSVLLARSLEGAKEPVAVLFGCACHPVSLGKNYEWDSDYCGAASARIERELGGQGLEAALFFQGCAGDLDPRTDFKNDLERVGSLVLALINDGPWEPVGGPIATELECVRLPFVALRPELEAWYEKRRWGVGVRESLSREERSARCATERHSEEMLRRIGQNAIVQSVGMPTQAWKFNGLTLLGLGHEVVSGYDAAIRGQVREPVWVMAYVNEVALYVPRDHQGPSYTSGWDGGNPWMAGAVTNLVAFGWPVPLRTLKHRGLGSEGATTEEVVMEACRWIMRA
jgi:hypothetical protein